MAKVNQSKSTRTPYKNFRNDKKHPTRAEPETVKKVTPEISFWKTLTRVCRYYPDGVDRGVDHAVAKAKRFMPFIEQHYRSARPELVSHKKLNKAMVDAACAVSKTMKKYCPPYPNTGLTTQKRAEVMLCKHLLETNRVIEEGQVEIMVQMFINVRGTNA